MAQKHIVYILQSDHCPDRFYTGLTSDLVARLDAHNAGRCHHTAPSRPWRDLVHLTFADEPRAVQFERYLKTGTFHMKSHDRVMLGPRRKQSPAAVKGTEHLGAYGGFGPKSVGAICDPADFTGVFEVLPRVLWATKRDGDNRPHGAGLGRRPACRVSLSGRVR